MRKYIILLFILFSATISFAQNITNVNVRQEGKNIVITYYLDKEANVSLQYKVAGTYGYGYPQHTYGDVGVNVQPGLKTIIWKVLLDHDKFIHNNVQFIVSATKSLNNIVREEKKISRKKKNTSIYPFGGLDIFGGYCGIGMTGYIPVSKHITSLVLDYYYTSDKLHYNVIKDDNYTTSAIVCNVGLNFMLHERVGVFFAPGIGWRDYYMGNGDFKWKPCFSFHTGLGVSFGWFLLTAHIAYPTLIGAGIGFTL